MFYGFIYRKDIWFCTYLVQFWMYLPLYTNQIAAVMKENLGLIHCCKTDTHSNNCFEKDFPSIKGLQAFISLSFP